MRRAVRGGWWCETHIVIEVVILLQLDLGRVVCWPLVVLSISLRRPLHCEGQQRLGEHPACRVGREERDELQTEPVDVLQASQRWREGEKRERERKSKRGEGGKRKKRSSR